METDLDYLAWARQLKITGGNIHNIVLNAAYLAARNGKVIEMDHVRRATRREFEKIGKLCDTEIALPRETTRSR